MNKKLLVSHTKLAHEKRARYLAAAATATVSTATGASATASHSAAASSCSNGDLPAGQTTELFSKKMRLIQKCQSADGTQTADRRQNSQRGKHLPAPGIVDHVRHSIRVLEEKPYELPQRESSCLQLPVCVCVECSSRGHVLNVWVNAKPKEKFYGTILG